MAKTKLKPAPKLTRVRLDLDPAENRALGVVAAKAGMPKSQYVKHLVRLAIEAERAGA